jgi:cyclase
VGVPVIASGGAGSIADVHAGIAAGADAVAVAALLHYRTESVDSIKRGLRSLGDTVRLEAAT